MANIETYVECLATIVPHPIMERTYEMPGAALTAGRYDGFGAELFVPVSDEISAALKEEFNIEDE